MNLYYLKTYGHSAAFILNLFLIFNSTSAHAGVSFENYLGACDIRREYLRDDSTLKSNVGISRIENRTIEGNNYEVFSVVHLDDRQTERADLRIYRNQQDLRMTYMGNSDPDMFFFEAIQSNDSGDVISGKSRSKGLKLSARFLANGKIHVDAWTANCLFGGGHIGCLAWGPINIPFFKMDIACRQ
jgi:hypothetical protein